MHTYIIIKTSNGGVCVEFEKNTTLVLLVLNCPKVLTNIWWPAR